MKKRIIYTLLCIVIIMVTVSGCSLSIDDNTPSSPTKSIGELQNQNDNLQKRLQNYNKIYDESLKKSIDKYCSNYLSFQGEVDKEDVESIKKYLTSDYYNELKNQPFKNQGDNDYLQSTAVDELYYENISTVLRRTTFVKNVNVIAICYQSIVVDNNTTTTKKIFKFIMTNENKKWLISAVEILN